MLNYFNFKPFNGQFLLTNDLGRYMFLDGHEFKAMLDGTIGYETEVGKRLVERGFISSGSAQGFLNTFNHSLRDAKNYLFSATSLHIFVVTTACNMACIYCQANGGVMKQPNFMTIDTAEMAVKTALSTPAKYLSFEFQGGEPLLNYSVVRYIIEYTEQHKEDKIVQYSIVSNLTLLTEEVISFLQEHQVSVATSLDGPAQLHNLNRPYRCGSNTHCDVVRSINRIREAGLRIGAIQTTTKESLKHAKSIVDTYYELGFNSVFLRPLTPLGCAKQKWRDIGYTPAEFSKFYGEAISYILQMNRDGCVFQEGHAAILFSKILHNFPVNYMELRSPCGASVGQVAYYTNGDVFTCDEGRMLYEMGNDSFKLGNVFTHRYDQLMQSKPCRAACLAGITESIPSCCDCVYQPYCGVCPVVNIALYGDLLPKVPKTYRCGIYTGILDTLFSAIQHADEQTTQILENWYA